VLVDWHNDQVFRGRSLVVSLAAWTIGAIASVAIGLAALTTIGGGLANAPLDDPPAGAGAQLDPQPSDAPGPADPTPVASDVAGAPADQTVTSRGGQAVVHCTGSTAYLYRWIPDQGYHVDDFKRGPGTDVRVRFESSTREVTITATCQNGVVQPVIWDNPEGSRGHDDSN
jgi:hypothetical protein